MPGMSMYYPAKPNNPDLAPAWLVAYFFRKMAAGRTHLFRAFSKSSASSPNSVADGKCTVVLMYRYLGLGDIALSQQVWGMQVCSRLGSVYVPRSLAQAI